MCGCLSSFFLLKTCVIIIAGKKKITFTRRASSLTFLKNVRPSSPLLPSGGSLRDAPTTTRSTYFFLRLVLQDPGRRRKIHVLQLLAYSWCPKASCEISYQSGYLSGHSFVLTDSPGRISSAPSPHRRSPPPPVCSCRQPAYKA
jgi:hypothetical protein